MFNHYRYGNIWVVKKAGWCKQIFVISLAGNVDELEIVTVRVHMQSCFVLVPVLQVLNEAALLIRGKVRVLEKVRTNKLRNPTPGEFLAKTLEQSKSSDVGVGSFPVCNEIKNDWKASVQCDFQS